MRAELILDGRIEKVTNQIKMLAPSNLTTIAYGAYTFMLEKVFIIIYIILPDISML